MANSNDAARRELDVPPGRFDRAAIPVAVAGIVDQIVAEVSARLVAPPTADERPVAAPPSVAVDRIGERSTRGVIESPVRDQGDKQPHLEAHNWRASDHARMMAREEQANAEAIAARDARRESEGGEAVATRIEAAFGVAEPESEPTLDAIAADPSDLTPEQKAAVKPVLNDPVIKPAVKAAKAK